MAATRAVEACEAMTRARDEAVVASEKFMRAVFADAAAAAAYARAVGSLERGARRSSGPLGAVETLTRVVEMSTAAGAGAEKRIGAIASRSRSVGAEEMESAIGCGMRGEDARARTRRRARRRRATGTFGVVVSVGLPCSTNVVRFGRVEKGSWSWTRERWDPAAPSIWAMTPKSTPEAPTKETQWLYCTDKGSGRAEKMPHFKWTGDLRPAMISHDERTFRGCSPCRKMSYEQITWRRRAWTLSAASAAGRVRKSEAESPLTTLQQILYELKDSENSRRSSADKGDAVVVASLAVRSTPSFVRR